MSGKSINIEISLLISHVYSKAPVDWTELLANYSLVSLVCWKFFLEVNNRGGGVVGNFCRDVGFTESSMLYANLSHLSYQNKNSMLDVQYLVSEKCHTFT